MPSFLLVIALFSTLISSSLVYSTGNTLKSLNQNYGAGFTIVPAPITTTAPTLSNNSVVVSDGTGFTEDSGITFNRTTDVLNVGGFISSASSTIAAPLQVAGNIQASSSVSIGGVLAITGATGTSTIASGQGFTIGSTQFVLQQGSGNVGIGTLSPSAIFHAVGNQILTGDLSLYGGDINLGTGSATSTLSSSGGNLGVGSTTPWGTFSVEMGTVNPSFVVSNNGSSTPSLFVSGVNQNGYVGIGTSTPNQHLTVVGNISNLSNTSVIPSLLGSGDAGEIVGGANSLADRMLEISHQFVYVADASSNKLRVFDTSTNTPALIATLVTGATSLNNIFLSGRYIYGVSDGRQFTVIDVSKPQSPVLVKNYTTPTTNGSGSLASLYVSGRYAYVTEGGAAGQMLIIDISDPANPLYVSSTLRGGANTAVGDPIFVNDRYAYVASLGNLHIFDISNPAVPTETGVASTTNGVVSMYVSGKYAYLAAFSGNRMEIFDISTSTPAHTADFTVTQPHSLTVSGRYAYIASEGTDTIKIVDVNNPFSPVSVGSVAAGDGPVTIRISGKYAYVISRNDNLIQKFEIPGIETTSAIVHSLETGNLRVQNDIISTGQLQARGLNVGSNGIFSAGPLSVGIASSTQSLPTSGFFQGSVGIGSTTPSTLLSVSGTGTTTAYLHSTTAGSGSGIQLKSPDGSFYCVYVANGGTLTTAPGACR